MNLKLPKLWIRSRAKYFFLFILFVLILDYCGILIHFFELDFNRDFHYPIDGDVLKYAKQLRRGEKPDVEPINIYNYTFLLNPVDKCKTSDLYITPKIIFLVKSSIKNADRRDAIRRSWGNEKRFSDVEMRTVFLLGIGNFNNQPSQDQDLIVEESKKYNDIVQSDFYDTYFNNTIKIIRGFQWAVENCARSKFFMFVDDDFYVSPKNVLRFLKDPVRYPEYLEEAEETIRKLSRKLAKNEDDDEDDEREEDDDNENDDDHENDVNPESKHNSQEEEYSDNKLNTQIQAVKNRKELIRILQLQYIYNLLFPDAAANENELHNNENRKIKRDAKKLNNGTLVSSVRYKRDLFERELSNDARLWSGFVITSKPHRLKSSKWHISLDEYPWHMYPAYVTAGAFIMSKEALMDMYYVSKFTRHFRFDDVFLGIVGLKSLIEPLHNEEFYFHKALYSGPYSYKYVIASHGFGDPKELLTIWSETRSAGHS